MGFGPKVPDAASGASRVREIVALLYPERATPAALDWFERLARVLLESREELSFSHILRFLVDPDWRREVLSKSPAGDNPWPAFGDRPIAPAELDPDFAWLLEDRLAADTEGWVNPDPPPA